MITYNHEAFIAQAIEGVLMQITNFRFELIIGEDFSTDKTREICIEYQKKYPELIKLLPSDKNLGMQENGLRTIKACTGKYIALCEGDDYWTDPYKLQKQVDFLEANEDAVICYHPMIELFQDGAMVPQKRSVFHVPISTRQTLFNVNFISTLTVVFKSEFLNLSLLSNIQTAMGDYPLYLSLLADPNKNILYIDEYMGVYRSGRAESISNAIPMKRFHNDFIIVLKFFMNYYNNLTNSEMKSIKNGISREQMNLYKISMLQKKILESVKFWFFSFFYFVSSKFSNSKYEFGLFSWSGFIYNTKLGIKNLFK